MAALSLDMSKSVLTRVNRGLTTVLYFRDRSDQTIINQARTQRCPSLGEGHFITVCNRQNNFPKVPRFNDAAPSINSWRCDSAPRCFSCAQYSSFYTNAQSYPQICNHDVPLKLCILPQLQMPRSPRRPGSTFLQKPIGLTYRL